MMVEAKGGTRYCDWDLAKRFTTSCFVGRLRLATKKARKHAVTSRIGDGDPLGRSKRLKYPVESALDTKIMVEKDVVYI